MFFKSISLAITCLVIMVYGAPTSTNTGCGGKPTEVVFVLDSSNNVTPQQFKAQIPFVKSIVSEFEVGNTKTRVGLILYGEYVQEAVGLRTQYSNKMNLLTAISHIYQLRGRAFTDRALMHAREMIKRDGRKDVPKIIILLTNGKSAFQRLTVDEALKTKQANITIFSIGIGHDADKSELHKIASKKEFSFNIDNEHALKTIKRFLAIEACGVQADSPYYSTYKYDPYYHQNTIIKESKQEKLEKTCGGRPAEIVFCLDASGSIWGPDFRKQLEFVSTMTGVFQIAPNMTRIGVLTFGDNPREWFKLDSYRFEEEVKGAIDNIHQSRGGTKTFAAIKTMREKYFSEDQVRKDVVKIAIVITDGKSENHEKTAHEAALLRKQGVYVFSIGVGDKLDERELHNIAGTKDYVFKVDNYEALDSIKKILSAKTCIITLPPTTTPPITECGERRPADLVFAMPPDANAAQAAKIIHMMSKTSDLLSMGENAVRIGMVPKDCVSLPGLELSDKPNTELLLDELHDAFAAAHTPKVLRYMRKKSFTEDNGHRSHAQKMGIIILDKASPNYKHAAAEARKARLMGVEIFIIAIGDDITDDELKQVASFPVEDHVIRVDSYDQLAEIVPDLVDLINKSCIEYIPPELIEEDGEDDFVNKIDFTSNYS